MSMGPGLGGGGFYNELGPQGRYGMWPGCGCSSLLMILAGFIMICAGGMRMFGQ